MHSITANHYLVMLFKFMQGLFQYQYTIITRSQLKVKISVLHLVLTGQYMCVTCITILCFKLSVQNSRISCTRMWHNCYIYLDFGVCSKNMRMTTAVIMFLTYITFFTVFHAELKELSTYFHSCFFLINIHTI